MTLLEAPPVAAPEPPRPTPAWRQRPQLSKLNGSAALQVGALLTLSLLAAWALLYGTVLSGLRESGQQHRLFAEFRTDLVSQTAPTGGAIPLGNPVAVISAPRAGVKDTVIVEGTSSEQLADGPGHLRSTVLPGQAGVSVLLGRGLTYGGPFRSISKLRAGDQIKVTTQQGVFTYVVDRVRHPGDPGAPALPAGGSRLMLVSAAGHGFLSSLNRTREVFVDATLKGNAAIGSGIPIVSGALPADELPMHGDTAALILLVLGLQAVLLALGAVVWVGTRWTKVQTWVVGTPLVLAALWAVSGQAVMLLPNLI